MNSIQGCSKELTNQKKGFRILTPCEKDWSKKMKLKPMKWPWSEMKIPSLSYWYKPPKNMIFYTKRKGRPTIDWWWKMKFWRGKRKKLVTLSSSGKKFKIFSNTLPLQIIKNLIFNPPPKAKIVLIIIVKFNLIRCKIHHALNSMMRPLTSSLKLEIIRVIIMTNAK